ncbi:YceI-like domain-containing protein [Daejeonella rubra]|uniref:YceI-like domain-containing protein n=1 Tax=Daejeonella rubra TaxID=990371 RepID=A0A1G9LRB0_9SPHI|nr:YceI family protein [Daejeonella rubra]SDL64483.1 YceI-like domain-containing protein [Daejeonella rubra]
MKIILNSIAFKLRYITLSMFLILSAGLVFGQQQLYTYHSGVIEVSGFTNNYNWKMKTDSVDCRAQLTMINRQLKAINSLSFTVPVKKLSSPNTYMDRIAHRTLKSYPFDKIYFHYVKSEISPWDDKDQYLIKASGNLTVAGVTHSIKMDLIATVINDGTITFAGTHKLKLSTYQVTPKKSLMGTLKTSDDVTVNFVVGVKPLMLSATSKR